MSISDRLGEIRDRYVEWHQDRGDHTPAPDTETWADADHPDESMEHCIVRNDVPALVAALRAVLELHVSQFDRTVDHDGEPGTYCDMCNVGPWPCPTVRAVQAALGEEASDE